MEALKNTYAQLRRVWTKSGRPTQIATVFFAVVSVAAIVGVGIWSAQPQYYPLASGLSPEDIAAVMTKLEAEQIPYELNHAGTAISVPKSSWNKARIAAGDTIVAAGSPPPLEGSPWDIPEQRRYYELRDKERRLEHTIARMNSVKSATVHISHKEDEVFLRPEASARASVQLELERGRLFSREQAESVVALVSHAVEGLTPDSVTVSDTMGRQYPESSGIDADVESQFEYQKRMEAYLASKAQTMLATMLGLENAIVRVTTDVDFRRTTSTLKTYDPDGKVIRREETTSKTTTQRDPVGRVGTTPNLGGGSAAGNDTVNKEETVDAEYSVPETIEELIEAPGTIKRMTVAAMVDLSGTGENGAKVTIEQVRALIQVATGFDASRDDQIEVVEADLPDAPPPADLQTPGMWEQVRELVQVGSLGLASLVAFVLGWLTLRRIKPVTIKAADSVDSEASRARLIANITETASRDPDTVSRIVAAWLNEPLQPPESPPATGGGDTAQRPAA